jgi:hypothetical protein
MLLGALHGLLLTGDRSSIERNVDTSATTTSSTFSPPSSPSPWPDLLRFESLSLDNHMCRHWTGTPVSSIRWLARVLLRSETTSVASLRRISAENRVCRLLFEMRGAFSAAALADMIGVDRTSFARVNTDTANALATCLRQDGIIGMPRLKQWTNEQEHVMELIPTLYRSDLIIIGDGTSLQTKDSSASRDHRLFWVHYKGHVAARWTMFVTATGRIVHVTRCKPGRINDDDAFRQSGVIDALNLAYNWDDVAVKVRGRDARRRVAFFLDQGYKNLSSLDLGGDIGRIIGVCTMSGKSDSTPAASGVEFSSEISPIRSLVERIFGWIKQRYQLLAKLRAPPAQVVWERINDFIFIACCVYNHEKCSQN